jgi:osmotically-inducible protein OsmY
MGRVDMKRKFLAVLAAGMAFCMITAGCTEPQNPTGAPAGSPGGAGQAQTDTGMKPAVGDDKIKEEVKKAFAGDPELSKETIEVDVKDGRVILKGTVSSSQVKMKAEDTARNVPEVFGVDTGDLLLKE